jgi:hypothetical protein
MNLALELHDSELAKTDADEEFVRLTLYPAIFHRSIGNPGVDTGVTSTGEAELIFHGATIERGADRAFGSIWKGQIELDGSRHEGLIPIPWDVSGQVRVSLELASGSTLSISASRLTCASLGNETPLDEFVV